MQLTGNPLDSHGDLLLFVMTQVSPSVMKSKEKENNRYIF